ncbi:MAG: N-formylglutamate amidohydrolase [Desulfatitalea sp.]|nr:N-formylglutamate amidohydrolase [Desulfatitalea sp.]NNK00189.1 N-formylglutamate amidohydrolase [Desulfatitalea sp.]
MMIITCEHGGNKIPKAFQRLFEQHREILETHCSYDKGALITARSMAKYFRAPLFAATTSRLLVDLNRRVDHPRLFSQFTRHLAPEVKQKILRRHYFAHRDSILKAVTQAIEAGQDVLQIACHSFTPFFNDRERPMDVGLLYDPRRTEERDLCRRWKNAMRRIQPQLNISSNAPYKGVSDGLTTYLRTLFPKGYRGIELELNQRLFLQERAAWRNLNQIVIQGLAEAVC